ncbi:hypothetical protein ACB092_12G127900 [Castanea dentata]
MVRESARKCSHCGVNGHNSRTCNNNNNNNNIANGNNSVKIFGVYLPKIVDDSMKKSFSTGNLSSKKTNDDEANTGYLSDGIVQRKAVDRERKKGTPWTEEEHVVFLAGLKKLGKGDWRGISKKFVTTRSPSQVASHAQKYFLRQAAIDKKKRRPSVFDLSLNEYATAAVQNVNRFPHVCIDIPPSAQMSPLISGAPNYSWCPSMVGMPGNDQFIPTVNFARQSLPSYSWLPGTQRNFGTCAPVIIHPSGIPSPKSFPHSLSH